MAGTVKHRATYQDVLDAPENMVAELIDGELHLQPRPAKPHARTASILGGLLIPPFDLGREGPGGWWILYKPELHLGADVMVPDLAAWRRANLPALDTSLAYFAEAPDWVCEVLSAGTEARDRAQKLPRYAQAGVEHAWLIHPLNRTLEVFEREGTRWMALDVYRDHETVRARPFDAFELRLNDLWLPDGP